MRGRRQRVALRTLIVQKKSFTEEQACGMYFKEHKMFLNEYTVSI